MGQVYKKLGQVDLTIVLTLYSYCTHALGGGGELSGDMGRLYDMVTRHFLASVSPDATYLSITVSFHSGGGGFVEVFTATGRRMLDAGFTLILPHLYREDTILPPFQEGVLVEVSPPGITVRQGKTSPPGYLTESELLGLMESHGVGTDASMATHINNICERNYVYVGGGRTLMPTELGVALVHGYHLIDAELVLPLARSGIEAQCTLIAKGEARKEDVVRSSLIMFEAKFLYFVSKIAKMDALFEATFSPLKDSGECVPMSRCGKCKRYMTFMPMRPQRLFCPTCNETHSLPQNGTVKLYKELRCPIDDYELVLFSLGNTDQALGKTYPLCPYCYNHPPHDGFYSPAGAKMGCNSCLHPTCAHALMRHAVCQCPGESMVEEGGGKGKGKGKGYGDVDRQDEEDGGAARVNCPGVMCLDVNSSPNWKIACNVCMTLVRFHGGLVDVAVATTSAAIAKSTAAPAGEGGGGGGTAEGPTVVPVVSFYDVLGCASNATAAEIKKQFRTLAMQHHPDRGGDEELFKALQEAHEVLSDPEKRVLYDSGEGGTIIQEGGTPPSATSHSAGGSSTSRGRGVNNVSGSTEVSLGSGSVNDDDRGGGSGDTSRPYCAECGSRMLTITFHRDKSPLDNGELKYTNCVVCDDMLSSLTEMKQGRFKNVKLAKGGKGKGKDGKGKGKDGKGKGGKAEVYKGPKGGKGDPRMSFEDF
jgi:hypothetical protein